MKILPFASLIIIVCLAQPVSSAGFVIPIHNQNIETSWSAEISLLYGMQAQSAHTQPAQGSLGMQASLEIGRNALLVSVGDLRTNPWGFLGLRMTFVENPIRLTGEIRASLPSRVATINPWLNISVGDTIGGFSWTLGAQSGLFMVPMPNQRPMGPVLFSALFAGASYSVSHTFALMCDIGYSGSVGMIVPALSFCVPVFELLFALPIQVTIVDTIRCTSLPVAIKLTVHMEKQQ